MSEIPTAREKLNEEVRLLLAEAKEAGVPEPFLKEMEESAKTTPLTTRRRIKERLAKMQNGSPSFARIEHVQASDGLYTASGERFDIEINLPYVDWFEPLVVDAVLKDKDGERPVRLVLGYKPDDGKPLPLPISGIGDFERWRFETAIMPAIKLLNDTRVYHPHMQIVITNTGAELFESQRSMHTEVFLKS
jgi:hypothetical protein